DGKRVEYKRLWSLANREQLTKNKNDKYQNDLNFKLKESLRTRLSKAVRRKTKSGSAVKDLGCSMDEFRSYIESKFNSGMNWENYGRWHLDHIMPLCKFDLTNRKEF